MDTYGPTIEPSESVFAEAERWYARLLADDCTEAERETCLRWRGADPRNAQAYTEVERTSQLAAAFRFGSQHRLAVRRIRERAASAGRRRRMVRWVLPLAAACVVLALGVGWRHWDPVQSERHLATAVGERRAVTLNDGSRLLLDTDSAVSVRYSRKYRTLLLERGQAEFDVATAPGRPFVVDAGTGRVRAVGTRFQVRHLEGHVQVNLLEGAVEVAAPSLDKGERSAILARGEQLKFDARHMWVKSHVDMEVAQAWPRGELVFRERPLRELVEEMNRHTTVKLRIGDPVLGEFRFSGVFRDNDQHSLLQALEQVWSVRAERISPNEIVLLPMR